MGIAESVSRMQEELERLRARTIELTRGLSSVREGQVNFSDFLELRGTVGRTASGFDYEEVGRACGDTFSAVLAPATCTRICA